MMNQQTFSTIEEAISWVHGLVNLGMKPGLKRMEWMLERFNHPERKLKFIHIGGTNGKGSTVAFMRHVLQEAGFEVGSFTSPFIKRFQDRIQLNGADIPDMHLLEVANQLKPVVDELAQTELKSPTEFEVVTMLAILYYGTISYPDYVLWEVGLGGRLDSTNVVLPLLSVITSVDYDHVQILGGTIESIAREKAGIIKAGVPVVTGVKRPEALRVIEEMAASRKASLYKVNHRFSIKEKSFSEAGQVFDYRSVFGGIEDMVITMKGRHQLENVGVAIMALEVLKKYYAVVWEEEDLRHGLQATSWMGRMELISQQPLVLLDGAHNPQGIEALANSLQSYYADKHITVMFSAMKDKEIIPMLRHLSPFIDRLILTQFEYSRAATAQEMMKLLQAESASLEVEIYIEENWYAAYNQILRELTEDHILVMAGSLYFVSEVRNKILN
jgi:dihydrofolate synthase/folylpolyglutamate synthase